MDLDAECRSIFRFYFKMFVKEIENKYGLVGLNDVWKETMECEKKKKRKKNQQVLDHPQEQHLTRQDKLRSALHMMKHDDLFRHCIRNGIQPPHNREDMIKAILARVL